MGLITGQGLAYVLRGQLRHHPWSRALALLLVLCAVGVGNAVYEAGNLGTGRLGLETLLAWKAVPRRSN